MKAQNQPFADLSPDLILNALDDAGFLSDGRLMALNSYENRVYQVGQEDSPPVVAKFYRPDRWPDAAILEEHALVDQLATQELPVVAPLVGNQGKTLMVFGGYRFAVYPRQGGRAPELEDNPEGLERLGRLLGRIHAVGAAASFQARPSLDAQSFGHEPFSFLIENYWLPADLAAAYQGAAEAALSKVSECYERAGVVPSIRLHGDCYPGNILWTDAGPHFVDFDDSRMGPAIQDLWMLLSGNRQEQAWQLADLISGYEDFYEFNRRELHLIEALRTLRLIHYSAWLARRMDDPAFPTAFPWFNSHLYWQEQIRELQAQRLRMDEPPMSV